MGTIRHALENVPLLAYMISAHFLPDGLAAGRPEAATPEDSE
jgi:hypothetical protein